MRPGRAREEIHEARQAALHKYELWEQEALRVLAKEHPVVSWGRLIPGLVDDGPKLQAIDRLLKIERRRAEIMGYDAPKRKELTVISESMIDAEIARLEAELAEMPNTDSGADTP